ncbi:AarF/ABC1/UbiB kinase family protein, partial [Candidatus Parvarchaeota archaeon]|nr:AarF/ABC1/UbiB kinase family protein [Candidatus Parvarchaeota archaeon]
MPFADFDRKLKDINRLRQILDVLVKNELGFFVESLRLKKFLPLRKTIHTEQFIRYDTQPYRMVKVMEELGGTFIKLGQLLSIRPDLVPREYCNAFATLQDQVPPFPFPIVKAIVEKELGRKISQAFISFDTEPIAAASIGQVHFAKLRNGQKVAVKVQRPNAEKIFRTDIDMMYLFVYLLDKYHHNNIINPKQIVEEFEDYTIKELNYVNEAKNIEAFCRNLGGSDHSRAPKVFWDLTTEKVLTMEYLEGKKLSVLLKAKKQFNRKIIARNIV